MWPTPSWSIRRQELCAYQSPAKSVNVADGSASGGGRQANAGVGSGATDGSEAFGASAFASGFDEPSLQVASNNKAMPTAESLTIAVVGNGPYNDPAVHPPQHARLIVVGAQKVLACGGRVQPRVIRPATQATDPCRR